MDREKAYLLPYVNKLEIQITSFKLGKGFEIEGVIPRVLTHIV